MVLKRIDEDNVNASIVKLFKSYFDNRKIRYRYTSIEVQKTLSKGCPQGGPISPTIWNIIMNDLLCKYTEPNSEIIGYADDITVICWNKNLIELENTIGSIMRKITNWCESSKLRISKEKTKVLPLFNNKKFTITLNNNTIIPVDRVKILGITVKNHRNKNKLDFMPHIDDTITKTTRASGYLLGLTKKAWGLDSKRRIVLYKTLFRNTIIYGSTIWYQFIPKKAKDKLNSLQYKILKHGIQAYNTTSSNCTHIIARTPKLTHFIESNILKINIDYNRFVPAKIIIISNFINQKQQEYYEATNENFKSFFSGPKIPNFIKPNFYNVQFLTGHGDFNSYLFKIGKAESPGCSCGGEEQNPRHLLTDCPLTADLRELNQLPINLQHLEFSFDNCVASFCVCGHSQAFPLCLDHDCLYPVRTVKDPTRCREVLENSPPPDCPSRLLQFSWLIGNIYHKKKKWQAIGRMEAGQSQAEIARWLGVTRNVVSRLWKKCLTTANVARTPGQGRPRVTTLNQDRYLSLLVRRNRRMIASQLRSDLNAATGVFVSTDTIRRRLHKKGLYSRRPIICVPLTPPQKRARKLWCRQHVAWNPDEWKRVMFTDESRFSLNSDSRRVFVWREVGTRNNPRNMVEKDPYRSQGFMVWAGIFLGGRTALHIFRQGTLTGQRYRDEILAAYVMPQALEMGENFLLMDDNARPHRAGVVDTFLQNHAIARMNWPARSPDLNPIEHVWDNLGRRISSLQPPPRNTHELETALTQEWALIPQELINSLFLSMGHLCRACLSVKGDHTPY
ncbi:hypothetical protein LAZ67_2006425 [Cordylochernes scorpioides]|uniref:Reverse transcriptase domain-containing protein n=1 Tax=Cordylochernes scorpioides TaxID=51811 RepID=A0ABY6K628_9ARAC|nr:hypothetical protein LAZ67_2006425 [Cordylochernes scorpioides]